MKRTLLSLMLLVASLVSFAHDFEVDGIYYNVLSKDDLTCEVTSGDNKYTGSVVIPEQVSYAGEVFSVTSIGNSAFKDCSGLTSITIPNSVTSIGNYAFGACYSLPIVDNLRYADTYLVEAVNKSLSSCNIKEGTRFIGSDAFYNCSSLRSVTIPNSVTSIGRNAFSRCM